MKAYSRARIHPGEPGHKILTVANCLSLPLHVWISTFGPTIETELKNALHVSILTFAASNLPTCWTPLPFCLRACHFATSSSPGDRRCSKQSCRLAHGKLCVTSQPVPLAIPVLPSFHSTANASKGGKTQQNCRSLGFQRIPHALSNLQFKYFFIFALWNRTSQHVWLYGCLLSTPRTLKEAADFTFLS